MKIKVGVIFGGKTVENEVSIISAVQAMNQLDDEKYEIIPIYISKDKTWYSGKMLMDIEIYQDFDNLKKYAKKVVMCQKNGIFYLQKLTGFKTIVSELDIMFPIVHGNNVEDGSLQGYFETIGIPYVGPGIIGSSLGMDKIIQKQVFTTNDIAVVPYTWFYDCEYITDQKEIDNKVTEIGFPVIVKPATLGSSVGITIVKNVNELDNAINEASRYANKIIVEKFIENLIEVNCSVLGNYEFMETSVIEEVLSSNEILSYHDKYVGGSKGQKSKGMASTSRIVPARIDTKIADDILAISKKAFRILNLSGVCRIDYLIDKNTKKIYLNEPNTIPGSLAFYLWSPKGKNYRQLLDEMITTAIKEYKNNSKKICNFNTNILSNFNGLKGSKGLKGLKNKIN
ncbi:MAG: D-alanine--D-alanine ligase family protein [Bacilli bacterium]